MPKDPGTIYDRLVDVPSFQYVRGSGALSGSFGIDTSTITEQYDIAGTALAAAVPQILGYAKSNGTTINRTLPARHAEFPFMFASRITGLEPLGPSGQVAGPFGPWAKWKHIRITVQYETPQYRILSDGGIQNESERFTYIESIEAGAEFLQRKTGTFAWPSGVPKPDNNQRIPDSFSTALKVVKTKIVMAWVQVPDVGLFPGGFAHNIYAASIESRLGSVNDKQWKGYPPGTLLLEGWKATPAAFPTGTSGEGWLHWTVRLIMTYFDPTPRGSGAPNGYPDGMYGHQLAPYPGDGNWYRPLLVINNVITDQPANWRYPVTDYNALFTMNG